MADTTINIFGSSGEAMVGADTINTILASMDSKLTSDDINIETLGDGTVDVDVKNDNYTINLNHTHEGMAKLEIVDEEPSDPAPDTIYALVDDATDPTEIQSLWIAGLEFVGGGGGGTPVVLPYDAKVEYLQSTGTQYVNTGILPSTNFECEIKAEFTQNQQGFDTLLGSVASGKYGVALGLLGTDLHASYTQIGIADPNNNGTVTSSVKTLGLHTYKSSFKSSVLKIVVDGTENTKNVANNSSLPEAVMFLFARHTGGMEAGNYSMVKVYYCKIWNGGNLVFDAIPVRVGQVGYMYDKVSGELLGNLGSGNFTFGNDK